MRELGLFMLGAFLSICFGTLFYALINLHNPSPIDYANEFINSTEYTIDTTMMIHNNDTMYYYKFVKI